MWGDWWRISSSSPHTGELNEKQHIMLFWTDREWEDQLSISMISRDDSVWRWLELHIVLFLFFFLKKKWWRWKDVFINWGELDENRITKVKKGWKTKRLHYFRARYRTFLAFRTCWLCLTVTCVQCTVYNVIQCINCVFFCCCWIIRLELFAKLICDWFHWSTVFLFINERNEINHQFLRILQHESAAAASLNDKTVCLTTLNVRSIFDFTTMTSTSISQY